MGMTEAHLGKVTSGKRKRNRPRVEDRDGMEWYHDGRRPVNKRRVIDRGANRYLESIFDPVSNKVIHFDSRPLRDKKRG
jgi:hypothetical protein